MVSLNLLQIQTPTKQPEKQSSKTVVENIIENAKQDEKDSKAAKPRSQVKQGKQGPKQEHSRTSKKMLMISLEDDQDHTIDED